MFDSFFERLGVDAYGGGDTDSDGDMIDLARMSSAVHVVSEEEVEAEGEEEEEKKLVQLKKCTFDGNQLFRGQLGRIQEREINFFD